MENLEKMIENETDEGKRALLLLKAIDSGTDLIELKKLFSTSDIKKAKRISDIQYYRESPTSTDNTRKREKEMREKTASQEDEMNSRGFYKIYENLSEDKTYRIEQYTRGSKILKNVIKINFLHGLYYKDLSSAYKFYIENNKKSDFRKLKISNKRCKNFVVKYTIDTYNYNGDIVSSKQGFDYVSSDYIGGLPFGTGQIHREYLQKLSTE